MLWEVAESSCSPVHASSKALRYCNEGAGWEHWLGEAGAPPGPNGLGDLQLQVCLPLSSKIMLFAKIMMVCKLGLLSRTPREDVWMLLQACMGYIW